MPEQIKHELADSRLAVVLFTNSTLNASKLITLVI